MAIPLLDLKAQFRSIKAEVMRAVEEVFDEQGFILGPRVEQLEEQLAKYVGSRFALGVSSGTDALLLSLWALGVGPGDAVITTPFTFFATVGSIVRLGARPLFADIDPETFNISPKALETALGSPEAKSVKAIVPVHLFGQCCDMDPIMELARARELYVVEDAAQALGAAYPSGEGEVMAGAMGTTGCFSFFPSKNLGGAGDGGLITTSDEELYHKMRSMRTHGSHPKEKYRHIHLGGNFRLDALQAAVLLVKFKYLDEWAAGRRANARRYGELFTQAGLVERELVRLPVERWGGQRGHVFNQYVIRARDRDGLAAHLKQRGIGHAIYYPVPLHLAECLSFLGGKPGDLPEAERASREVLALPVYPELTPAQQEEVVGAIAEFYGL